MAWNVSTKGAQQIRDLSAQIKAAGGDGTMLRKFRKEIRDAGAPCVADLKSAVMGVKVTRGNDPYARRTQRTGVAPRRSTSRWGPRSTGLRARVADAVGISQTKKGIRIRVSATKVGPYGTSLPRYLDWTLPRSKRWNHPVFGNRSVWVTQQGSPWFFVTIDQHRTSFRAAVFDVLEQTKQELGK